MKLEDVKLTAVVAGNFSLGGVTLFIQKVQPFLSFVLAVLNIIAALYTVLHIWTKRKNAKVLTPNDPDI